MSPRPIYAVTNRLVYRPERYAPSEEVEVMSVIPLKRDARYRVRFIQTGREDEVPGTRVHGLWSDREAINRALDEEGHLAAEWVDEATELAIESVWADMGLDRFGMKFISNRTSFASRITDRTGLEGLGVDLTGVLAEVAHFVDEDGSVRISATGTALICEQVAHASPERVLALIEEIAPNGPSGPEYRWGYERRMAEVMRRWVESEEPSVHERLVSSEQEARRVTAVAARAISALRALGEGDLADEFDVELLKGPDIPA